MASKLPHPSTSDDFRKFRDRIRQSAPTSPIDSKWLIDNLGFSQVSNAGALLRALEATGFVNQGTLSERGRVLRGSSDTDEYRAAMREAIDSLIGKERADSIRAGAITPENLPGYLRQQFDVGDSVISKFLAGLRWLAVEAQDNLIRDACGGRKRTAAPATESARVRPNKIGKERQQSRAAKPVVEAVEPHGSGRIPEREQTSPGDDLEKSRLLNGELLQIRIHSNWKINDIQTMLRLMQMIERGDQIPEAELKPDATDDSNV